jgi:UDP-N-acetyl-D-mannosaminuronic acid dehydrogenase
VKVSVIGLGYIGLPTAAIMAKKNITVVGFDINKKIVETINKGKVHLYEPGLEEIVKECVENKSLCASSDLSESDVFIVAVPTPFKQNKAPDLSYIKQAAFTIAPLLRKGNTVILESTSPVGATEKLANWLSSKRKDLIFPVFSSNAQADIAIAHCPERVLPGKIIKEIVENDRIIGGVSKNCAKSASLVYKKFVKGECRETDSRTAEMSKLVENSFRDVNIAFANELSLISEKLGVDVWELIELANQHPRVSILNPGPGVGGHCIAVDPWFIVNSAPKESKMIKVAREVNDSKPNFVLKEIKRCIKSKNLDPSKITISCFGLSFKPDVDDLRESPALKISNKVSEIGFKKQYIIEPHIVDLPDSLNNKDINLVELDEGLKKGDILLFLVNHSSFYGLKKNFMKNKIVINPVGLDIN